VVLLGDDGVAVDEWDDTAEKCHWRDGDEDEDEDEFGCSLLLLLINVNSSIKEQGN
jgi:hypothetical protein